MIDAYQNDQQEVHGAGDITSEAKSYLRRHRDNSSMLGAFPVERPPG